MTTVDIGRRGEELAKDYLLQNGFTIRHANWHWGHKELDIVAEKGKNLHVIEVKTRAANFMVDPLASIDRQKQQNTIAAANAYVRRFGLTHNVQIDVIVVLVNGDENDITYIPSAFYPTCRR
jgi:putative endonuclease